MACRKRAEEAAMKLLYLAFAECGEEVGDGAELEADAQLSGNHVRGPDPGSRRTLTTPL
jgi:hypothetical protein